VEGSRITWQTSALLREYYLNFGAWFTKIKIFSTHTHTQKYEIIECCGKSYRLYRLPSKFSILPCSLNI